MNTGSDSLLIDLIARLTDDLRAGRGPDVESAAREHPEVGAELRELWAAALIAEELARPSNGHETTLHPRPPRPPAPPETPGQTIGDCTILEVLGRGGMGIVYRAEQRGLGRVVALKRLPPGTLDDDPGADRLRHEAAVVARLQHPHIVTLYDVGLHDGQPFLVMQLVEGTTLARLLADGPLPPRRAAEILAPVARAIAYAHERGVLHRDLKPSNILIDADGRPLVADFGLAKLTAPSDHPSLTPTGAILGTPSYMSPEAAVAGVGPVGSASDVYGLGAILYHCLTGRPPFQAASAFDTIRLVLESDPVMPRALNPRVDPDLEMVALKCLQKEPGQRYKSAAALADDLDAFLAGEPVSARSVSLRSLAQRVFAETHHAPVLENWGLLWMLHSLALLVFFGLTNWLLWRGVSARWPYVLLFTVGLGAWAAVFWAIRRRGGPITFVERQLAHVWGSGCVAINLLFATEWLLGQPVLSLAPMLAIINGMLFFVKAGILSGIFYLYALVTFLAIVPMALYPRLAPLIFGVVAAGCFFATGLKYHLRRRRALPAPIRRSS
ncbi:MAG TPA: serine/threonine-protein kinase [Isosphaeraceae bacterium]